MTAEPNEMSDAPEPPALPAVLLAVLSAYQQRSLAADAAYATALRLARRAALVQHHIQRMGDPDPAKRPTTAQALVESQRLRERVIAAGAP